MLKLTLMLNRVHDVPGMDQAQVTDLARMADDAGLHSIALGEHLALSSSLEGYSERERLRDRGPTSRPYIDLVAVLGAFAAVTSRIRLSTSILIAPLRPAVLLAKQLASLDVLSRGRCEPAFGMGWNREEFAALGVKFGDRRRILRDNIAACRALWDTQPATFRSETVCFESVYSMPQPVQKRIPILLGVKANAQNASVIAEFCDGWDCGPDDSKSQEVLRDGVETLRRAFRSIGRNPEELIVRAYASVIWHDRGEIDVERSLATSASMLDAGVNQFVLPGSSLSKGMNGITDVARVIDKLGCVAATY